MLRVAVINLFFQNLPLTFASLNRDGARHALLLPSKNSFEFEGKTECRLLEILFLACLLLLLRQNKQLFVVTFYLNVFVIQNNVTSYKLVTLHST